VLQSIESLQPALPGLASGTDKFYDSDDYHEYDYTA